MINEIHRVYPASAQDAISNKSLVVQSGFVGGSWVAGEKTFPVMDPATDSVIANVANLGKAEFDLAVRHAEASFNEFRHTSEHERSRLLHSYAALIRSNKQDLAILLTMENGKTLTEAEGEVEYGASFISWFAEEAIRSYGDIVPSQHPACTTYVTRRPIGVCGIIAPWNFPIAMITRKLGPALAAGCTVVIKPPSETPLCTLALVSLAVEAGFPPNVIQVVPTRDRAAVERLYTHPAVKKISFTGSTNVGKMITSKAANTMKKVSMELGGNAPFIVFNDAEVSDAVDGILACKFRCSGQTCVCANRIYVQSGIHDTFVEALHERMKTFKVGPGLDRSVTHGPLINSAAVAKVKSHIDDALAKGAKLVTGGNARTDLGECFIEPALVIGVTQEMDVAKEETFGPLAPVFMFNTVEEVLHMANDTEFGLAGYLFTENLSTITRTASQLEVGMIGINTGKISAAEAPFGGIKESGVGKEGSKYGLAEFQIMKSITLRTR